MKELLNDDQREALFGAIEKGLNDKTRGSPLAHDSGGDLQFCYLGDPTKSADR
jgi:hypothetical protein